MQSNYEIISQLLMKLEDYKQLKQYVERVNQSDDSLYHPICQSILDSLKNKDPIQCLMALRLGKDCIETKNQHFIKLFQEICLPQYEQLGEFRKSIESDDRGKYLFSESPNKNQIQYGNSCLRLILESIQVWAKYYPFDDENNYSLFYQTYANLKKKGVKFPDFKYFNPDEVNAKSNSQFQEPNLSAIYDSRISQKNLSQGSINEQKNPQQKQIQQYQQQVQVSQFNQSSNQIKSEFERLKKLLIEKVATVQQEKLFFKQLSQIMDQLIELDSKIDQERPQINSKQEQHEIIVEQMGIQEYIYGILEDYQQLMDGKIQIEEYKKKFQNLFPQSKYPKPDLSVIQEEPITTSIVDNQKTLKQRLESNINVDEIYQDHQNQIKRINEQHNNALDQKEKQYKIELSLEKSRTKEQIYQNELLKQTIEEKQIQIQELLQNKQQHIIKQDDTQMINIQNQNQQLKQNLDLIKKQLSDKTQNLDQLTIQYNKVLEKYNQQQNNLNKQQEFNQIDKSNKQLIQQQEDKIYILEQKCQKLQNENQILKQQQYNNQIDQIDQQLPNNDTDLGKQVNQLKIRLDEQKNKFTLRNQELQNQINNLQQQLQDNKKIVEEKQQKIDEFTLLNTQYEKTFQIQNSQNSELQIRVNNLLIKCGQDEQQKQLIIQQEKQIKELLTEKNILLNKVKNYQNQIQEPKIQPNINSYQQEAIIINNQNYHQIEPKVEYIEHPHYKQKTDGSAQPLINSNKPYDQYENFPKSIKQQITQRVFEPQSIIQQIDKNTIYPYTNVQEYYKSRPIKQRIGTIIRLDKNLINLQMNEQNILLFKKANLFNQNLIYQSKGGYNVLVNQQIEQNENDIYINYGVYFQAEKDNVNIEITLKNVNFNSIWISQESIISTLQKKTQTLLEISQLFQQFKDIPIILQDNINNVQNLIYLPFQILNFLKFQKISQNKYKRKWKQCTILRTNIFQYNNKLIENYADISQINGNFIIMNENKIQDYLNGIDEIKFASQFILQFYNIQGIFRIELIPNKQMIISFGFIKKINKLQTDIFSQILKIYEFLLKE